MSIWKKPILRFDVAGWSFSLSLLWCLILAIFVPLLLRLGFWQLDRAAERTQAMAALRSVMATAPIDIKDVSLADHPLDIVRVRAQGRLDWSRQILLKNQVHNTVAGYEVLVPMVFDDGRGILLSRGWLPPTPGKIPDLSPPKATSSEQNILGLAVVPPARLADYQREILLKSADYRALNAERGSVNWPLFIEEEAFETLSGVLGLALVPRILQPETGAEAFSYTRIWKPADRGPAVNYGYAAQWFGMAVLLIGAVITLNARACCT